MQAADLSSKLERLRIPGLSREIYCALSPQRLSLLPYRDFFCRCCALRGPRFGRRAFWIISLFGEGDGSAPALSVGSAPDLKGDLLLFSRPSGGVEV